MVNQLYYTIMADPPWEKMSGGKGADKHYNLMSDDQVKNLPVQRLCQQNAHLWLWVPNSLLPDGLAIMNAWGFTYRAPFIWIKPRLGLGNYLRNASEIVLFGTKGNAPVLFKGQPNWGFFPLQEHSHKPEEMYAIIERVSPGTYLELFARRRQPGWDAWGDEIDSDIIIPGYPVPMCSDKARIV